MGWKSIKEHYNIGHLVQVRDSNICIGSGYISDLIVIGLDGRLKKRYEDGFSHNADLCRYQSEMDADLEKLKELAQAPDTFDKAIKVYTYSGANIIEKLCEKPDWPNVTHDGEMMYENMFSTERNVVVEFAIRNAEAAIECTRNQIKREQDELNRRHQELLKFECDLNTLMAIGL